MTSLLIHENKLLKDASTFGIGGPCRYFIEIKTLDHAREALNFANSKRLRFHVLGKGSNTLFDDRGFGGVVISNKISFCKEISSGSFHVGAGYSFSLLGVQTAKNGWTGLEFASGIPGSVGGAVFMNAGANGMETADTLTSVDFLNQNGELETFLPQNMNFAYRSSIFQKKTGIIIGATFQLAPLQTAREKQFEILRYRKKTQPYSAKSAGCIFRNPSEGSAGSLIDKAGLKGASIGGAKVSEIHANFVLNTDNASCQDVLLLIAHIKQKVRETAGIELNSEIRHITYDGNDEST